MSEPTPEMIAMTRRIVEGTRIDGPLGLGPPDAFRAALAAIIETKEKAAALLREVAGPLPKGVLNGEVWVLHRCADAIESAAHLKEQSNAE